MQAKEHVRAAEQRPDSSAERAINHWEEHDPKEQWDCESVLTCMSNLDNHPGKIMEPGGRRRPCQQPLQRIHLSSKTGLPVTPSAKIAREADAAVTPDRSVLPSWHQQHRRGETAEQKRERKVAAKEARVRFLCRTGCWCIVHSLY